MTLSSIFLTVFYSAILSYHSLFFKIELLKLGISYFDNRSQLSVKDGNFNVYLEGLVEKVSSKILSKVPFFREKNSYSQSKS